MEIETLSLLDLEHKSIDTPVGLVEQEKMSVDVDEAEGIVSLINYF